MEASPKSKIVFWLGGAI